MFLAHDKVVISFNGQCLTQEQADLISSLRHGIGPGIKAQQLTILGAIYGVVEYFHDSGLDTHRITAMRLIAMGDN